MSHLSKIHDRPMSAVQIRSVAIAILILVLDGFDITVMAFTASAMSSEWAISDTQLGLLLSASLFGMALGSVFIAPLADRFGRRPVLITSLAVITIGMFLTSLSPTPEWLFAFRVLTGLGAGGMISNCVVLVSEFSNDRRRSFLTAAQAAGYPLGATLSGVFAGALIPQLGWRPVFTVAAIGTFALLLVVLVWLPESLDFLLAKGKPSQRKQAQRLLEQMGINEPIGLLMQTDRVPEVQSAVRQVLNRRMWARSVLLWLGYGLLISGYYFINSWTPKIIASTAGDPQVGVTFGVMVNAGGIIGTLLFAVIVLRYRPAPVLIGVLCLTAAAFIGFSVFYGQFTIAIVIASLLGLFATAGIGGFQTVGPQVYAPQNRASGVGFMIGFGRILSVVSPILVGALLDGGFSAERIFLVFAVPLALSALCVYGVHRRMAASTPPSIQQSESLTRKEMI